MILVGKQIPNDVKNLQKRFCETELSKVTQNWKGYLVNLTQCINPAVDLLK